MALTPDRSTSQLVLASASMSRAGLLRGAGVDFVINPADIDESIIKNEHQAHGRTAESCAMALAEAKASAVATRHPEALVIGADQILVCEDEWFDKPRGLAEAAVQLFRLRCHEHRLMTACCVYRNDEKLWEAVSIPRLTMRRFGDSFLARYIAVEGEAVLGSVGAYRIEGRGVQLFERIEGDHFAILGLPLLELLAFLRRHGVVGE
jgi:septum formation protein